jgi:hypothetical protein
MASMRPKPTSECHLATRRMHNVSLNLEVLQLLRCLGRSSTDWGHMGLWGLFNLAFRFLRCGVFWQLFGEWDELRGAW